MQVPSDLAAELSRAAFLSGQTPESFLREAIRRLIERTVPACTIHQGQSGFVPQPQTFSVYE